MGCTTQAVSAFIQPPCSPTSHYKAIPAFFVLSHLAVDMDTDSWKPEAEKLFLLYFFQVIIHYRRPSHSVSFKGYSKFV